jgi:hypothetical protein
MPIKMRKEQGKVKKKREKKSSLFTWSSYVGTARLSTEWQEGQFFLEMDVLYSAVAAGMVLRVAQ